MDTLADACSGNGKVSCLLFEDFWRTKDSRSFPEDAIAQEGLEDLR